MNRPALAPLAITLVAVLSMGVPACAGKPYASGPRPGATSVGSPPVASSTVASSTVDGGDAGVAETFPWGPLGQRCDRRPSRRPKTSSVASAAVVLQEGRPSPSPPRTLVASPDGSLVATGGGPVNLWDPSTGVLRASIPIWLGADRLSFSPDGETLAVASYHAITLLDTSSGEVLRRWLPGSDKPTTALSWTEDGESIVTATADGTLHAWNVGDGRERARVSLERGAEEMTEQLTFSPSGALVAAGGGLRTVKVWDTKTGALRATLEGEERYVFGLAFSPDSERLAVSGAGGTLRVWDMRTNARVLTSHTGGSITDAAWRRDGEVLALAVTGGGVRVLDAHTGAILAGHVVTAAGPHAISKDAWGSVSWNAAGDTLAVAFDTQVAVLSMMGPSAPRIIGAQDDVRANLAWSCAGSTLFFPRSGAVASWDAAGAGAGASPRAGMTAVRDDNAELSPDGRTLLMHDGRGALELSSPLSEKPIRRTIAPGRGFDGTLNQHSSSFSPDGRALLTIEVSTGSHGWISSYSARVWDVARGQLLGTQSREFEGLLPLGSNAATWIDPVWSHDGSSLVVAGSASPLGVAVWQPGVRTRDLDGSRSINSFALSHEGALLATLGHVPAAVIVDTVSVLAVASGKLLATIPSSSKATLTFAPSGKSLMIASCTGAEHWKIAPTTQLAAFAMPASTPKDCVVTAMFTRDEATVALFAPSGAYGETNGTVSVFDALTGATRFSSAATHVVFSPDGATLATSTAEGRIEVRDALTGVVQKTFEWPGRAGSALHFSPDGKLLFSSEPPFTFVRVADGLTVTLHALRRDDRRALVAMSSRGLLDTEDVTLPLLRLRAAGDLRSAPISALEPAALIRRRGLLRDLWTGALP